MKYSIIRSAAGAGVFALLAATTSAFAADIVTYKEQPVAAPVQSSDVNWNGVYVGGTIGGSWGSSDTKLRGTNGFNVNSADVSQTSTTYGNLAKKSVDPNSFVGGLYAGYNFQPTFLANSFLRDVVLGIETDFLWASGDGSGRSRGYVTGMVDGAPVVTNDFGYKADVRQNWNGATRLRVGYAMGPQKRLLPYFAAGVSYANIRGRSSVIDDQGNSWTRRHTDSRAGWNIGAGVDYIPPILNDHIVLRAEYRFTDFGAGSMNRMNGSSDTGLGSAVDLTAKQSVKFNQNDFRVGVAYKF